MCRYAVAAWLQAAARESALATRLPRCSAAPGRQTPLQLVLRGGCGWRLWLRLKRRFAVAALRLKVDAAVDVRRACAYEASARRCPEPPPPLVMGRLPT
jgi:hypothetical protein